MIAQKCFEWLENKQGTIASKAFSIHILAKIIDHEPELCHEVKDITESILPYASAGMTNAAEKLLKRLEKWVINFDETFVIHHTPYLLAIPSH